MFSCYCGTLLSIADFIETYMRERQYLHEKSIASQIVQPPLFYAKTFHHLKQDLTRSEVNYYFNPVTALKNLKFPFDSLKVATKLPSTETSSPSTTTKGSL